MKTNHDESWRRLVALARQAPASEDGLSGAPLGFATRVAARAFSPVEKGLANLFEPFAFRALSVASLLAVVACVFNLNPVVQAVHDEIVAFERDPVSSAIDL